MDSTTTFQLVLPLVAVIVGGLLTILGGYTSTVMLERRRLTREERSLAFAFRGEINALLQHLDARDYAGRFAEIIEQIRQTGEPFFAPYRVRYEYFSVYRANVNRIGTLRDPLPEMIASFYTQMTSVLEDMSSLGDGTYASLPVDVIIRIYSDDRGILENVAQFGGQIVGEINRLYPRDK